MPPISSAAHSPKSIRAIMQRLRNYCAVIQSIAETMDEFGISSMTVSYQSSVIDSMDGIQRWMESLSGSLTDELKERGAYGAKEATDSLAGETGTTGTIPKKKVRKIRT